MKKFLALILALVMALSLVACGADGMVGGQVLDTVYDVSDAEGLTQLNRLKTGMMISGALLAFLPSSCASDF